MSSDQLSAYEQLQTRLLAESHTWLITGVAGFIGSNLLEALLTLNQRVVGLDNLSTGYRRNLDEVQSLVSADQWNNFTFVEGDICNLDDCRQVCEGIEYVLHQAALGSVPRSLADPMASNAVNVGGFLNMLVASRDAKVCSFTYAASSSTYGDHPALPKVEERIGKPLSPYAVTKYVNELYADVFSRNYSFDCIGLRYFNVFGRRQNPNGAYAAVIPKWISALVKGEIIYVNGDGETSRDFCYIDNAIQANLLAATTFKSTARNHVYNVAAGAATTLVELHEILCENISNRGISIKPQIIHRDFREGDVKHSLANIDKIAAALGYVPTYSARAGLNETVVWYLENLQRMK